MWIREDLEKYLVSKLWVPIHEWDYNGGFVNFTCNNAYFDTILHGTYSEYDCCIIIL